MRRKRQPLSDYYDLPEDMLKYLRHFGRHFNRKMYEFAVSQMWKEGDDGEEEWQKPLTKEEYDAVLEKNGVKLENDVLCDGIYVMSMAMSDFYGSSLQTEQSLALYVKDYIDDPDQEDGFVFNRFLSDCQNNGTSIEWEDML